VLNKPGAAGQIGAAFVADAPADGYTLLYGGYRQSVVAPLVEKNLSYDPVKDLPTIAFTTTIQLALVVDKDSPYKSVSDLRAALKEGKDRITYGSSGTTTPAHITATALNALAEGKAQAIQYKGSAPALQDLIAGRLTYVFDAIGAVATYAANNQVLPLATLAKTRVEHLPSVPTMAEAEFPEIMELSDWQFWGGIQGSSKIPPDIVERINEAITKVSADPDLID
jgi:tripartite-type tricarboxylate transporter receptor subunit TctC